MQKAEGYPHKADRTFLFPTKHFKGALYDGGTKIVHTIRPVSQLFNFSFSAWRVFYTFKMQNNSKILYWYFYYVV